MDDKIALPKEYVSVKIKLNFSLGSLANGLMSGLVFANLTFYYNIKLGADWGLLSIGWLIFAIWNTLNDPIASYFIDNTRTKIGRRIPFIRYGSIFYGLTFLFCWFPISPLDNQVGLFFNFLAALFLFDTMYTIVGACFFSLPNEIAITAKQRASLSAYTTIFGFINLVLGLILPIVLLTGQQGLHPLFIPTILFIECVCSLLLFLTSFGIKENMFAQLQEHEGFFEGLKLTFKNRAFLVLIIPAFCMQIIAQITSTGLLYYIDYNISGQSPLFIVITFIAGIIFGGFINLKRIVIWQPRKTGIINLLVLGIALVLLFFIGNNSLLAAIPFFLVGFGYIGILVTNPVLMGDVIDNDELLTGKRREAIYGGVNAIITKPAISIANSAFLSIIELFGFVAPIIVSGVDLKQPQNDIGLIGILVAFCLFPSALLFISAFVLRWFPLDGPEWLKKKKYIMEIHEEKEKQYLESISKKLDSSK